MDILDTFPTPEEFYKNYWGQKPFVVRKAIAPDLFDDLIDGGELAALSLENDVKSRIVVTQPEGNKWSCEHGPFEEERFSTLGDGNWSLLVQNVEQYHTDTAALLNHFNFSPRWLLDDIMVSYSEMNGSVGPHTDSYHVFLVQGIGKRRWTVGDTPLQNEECIEGLDLKVLKNGVQGDTVEVTMGDVIYIPPLFAHEGMTLENAMTFSIGFLGPKMSELLIEYGHYLEQFEQQDTRYAGQGLSANSAEFLISPEAHNTIKEDLMATLKTDSFAVWLAEYFSTSGDYDTHDMHESLLSNEDILARLEGGENLYRPNYIKLSITTLKDGTLALAAFGKVIPTTKNQNDLVQFLNKNTMLSVQDFKNFKSSLSSLSVIKNLYDHKILFFEEDDLDECI